MTHICVSKSTIIGSDNGLSPGRRQAIIWTDAGILLIGSSGTNFSEIEMEIHTFSFKKMHLKMSPGKWPFCLGLNVLMNWRTSYRYILVFSITALFLWLCIHHAVHSYHQKLILYDIKLNHNLIRLIQWLSQIRIDYSSQFECVAWNIALAESVKMLK